MQNKVLLGDSTDSGYGLSRYLITPLPNPVLPQENLFQESLLRTRNVERSYGNITRTKHVVTAFETSAHARKPSDNAKCRFGYPTDYPADNLTDKNIGLGERSTVAKK
ncbi:hypothetical protein NQ317_018965 [Molorchus minor]|uniref:Uncharacterized protein n=1 Tax=Molorchus minor TaxID=1323400 RepID=A0ABQ9JKF1_9CUCU|nr:hypothetical protein NQ317_018965 [Molorchus minor]